MSATLSGILNIDKSPGLTSHDVVMQVRRLTGIKRVGHAGTLDPLATGVLLVCIGAATRAASYLQAGRKLYRAEVRLGQTTDTYDAEGVVLSTRPVPPLAWPDLHAALDRFRGEILQVPPMYSALKHQGRSLHHLARAGIEVPRQPRRIVVDELALEAWQSPDLTLRIGCSAGTYVRSIAHDLGEVLGCGAHIRSLRRLASGDWRAEEAVTIAELTAAGNGWQGYLHDMAAALTMLPAVVLDATESRRFALGQAVAIPPVYAAPSDQEMMEVRVFAPDRQLIGIGRLQIAESLVAPHKVFASDSE